MTDTAPPEGDGVNSAREEEVKETAERLLEEGATKDAPMPDKYKYLAEQAQLLEIELRKSYAKQEVGLRETYAKGLLVILALLLITVNVIFCFYADKGEHWKIPDDVIQIWLAATVVQVVGVVAVVTRYLFPNRDGSSNPPTPPLPPSSN